MGAGTVFGSIPETHAPTTPDSALAGYRPMGVSLAGAVASGNAGRLPAGRTGTGVGDALGTASVVAIVPTRRSAIAKMIGTAPSRGPRRLTRATTGSAWRRGPAVPRRPRRGAAATAPASGGRAGRPRR